MSVTRYQRKHVDIFICIEMKEIGVRKKNHPVQFQYVFIPNIFILCIDKYHNIHALYCPQR